jgi:AcrR family transcriptional regulator
MNPVQESSSMGIAERKEREKQLRREQIMEAAKKVFSEKGLAGATMENIAKEAELSPATLYLYFRNKDELYASLNLKVLQLLIEMLEAVQIGQPHLDPFEKLKEMEKILYEVYDKDPLNLISILRFQSSDVLKNLSPEMSSQVSENSRKALRALADVFENGIKEKQFFECSPIALADIVWSLFAGLVLWEESKKGFDSNKDHLKPTLALAMNIFRRGILNPTAPDEEGRGVDK